VLLASGASRVVADGRSVRVPRLLVDPDADWVAELTELPSDAGDTDALELVPKKIGNAITVSTESIEDADHEGQAGADHHDIAEQAGWSEPPSTR
jgi:HK97 family phage major capsid protein